MRNFRDSVHAINTGKASSRVFRDGDTNSQLARQRCDSISIYQFERQQNCQEIDYYEGSKVGYNNQSQTNVMNRIITMNLLMNPSL